MGGVTCRCRFRILSCERSAKRPGRYRCGDRRRYLLFVADELDRCGDEIGDDSVGRAIAHAVRMIRRNPDPR